MKNSLFLENESINKLLWKFSLPSVTGMLVGALYNVIDSIFVGQGVGTTALAAVTVAFPIMTILMSIGMLVGIGSASVISIALGEKKKAKAEFILGNAISMVAFLVLITTGITLTFLPELLTSVLHVTPEIYPEAYKFTFIILAGSVFMHVGFGLNNIIRAQGDPKTALLTQIMSAILNGILNYFFIFILHFGIEGSAFATILAQAFAALWVIFYFTKGRGLLRFKKKYLRPHLLVWRHIASIGVAPFLMQLGNSLVMIVLNVRVLLFGGTIGVAAFGIVMRLIMLVLMPVIGISQGAQPIIGYNYGARRMDRVIEALEKSIKAATCVCLIGFCFVEIMPETVARLFTQDEALITMSTDGMRRFLAALPFVGLSIIGAQYFQATGNAKVSGFLSILRQIIILIPLVYIFSSFWGIDGLWWAGATADLLSFVATFIVLRRSLKKEKWVDAQPSA